MDDGAAAVSSTGVIPPTHDDPFVRGGSAAFGGPLGRHAGSGWSWWTPLRVLIAIAIASSVLGYLQKLPCRNQPWQGGFQYSHACYNDIYPLYFGEGLADGKRPYLDAHADSNGQLTGEVEYPVLIGAAMDVGAQVDKLLYPKSDRGQGFLDVTWLMLMIAAVVMVVATALTARRRIWDAAMVAAAPALVLAGLINWDLLAVALTSLAMLAWSRKNNFVAGALLGLAIATKFYPLVFFLPLLMLCWRARQMRAFWVAVGGAAFAWVVVDVPIWIASPEGFARFYYFSKTRGADWGSIWYISEKMFTWNLGTPSLNLYEAGAIAIAFLGVCWLALAATRRPRLPQLCFLTLALFLVFNKVYSPQYVLWLLPLVVLARPRWRAFLLWQAAEIIYFLAIWMYLLDAPSGRAGKGLAWQPYAVAVGIRDVAVLALCALVVLDILHPDGDIVRADGSDDPAGGVLDGAPDRFDREPEPYESDDAVPVPA
ncbi:MAG TPA: glycosyltransferase 87 family protein [Acidothermaceae bacterium]